MAKNNDQTPTDENLSHQQILLLIDTFFKQGICITQEIIDYAFSTIGLNNYTDIEDLLRLNDNYSEGLTELIFNPPFTLRLQIEQYVPAYAIPDESIHYIKQVLSSENPTITCYFTDNKNHIFTIPLSAITINRFVDHCKLDRDLFIKNSHHLQFGKFKSHPLSLLMFTLMRNIHYSGLETHNNYFIKFITNVIDSQKTDEKLFRQCIQLLLKLLRDNTGGSGLYNLLITKKRLLERSVTKYKEYHTLLNQYNFEILRSEHISVPFVDIREAESEITLIEYIQSIADRNDHGLNKLL